MSNLLCLACVICNTVASYMCTIHLYLVTISSYMCIKQIKLPAGYYYRSIHSWFHTELWVIPASMARAARVLHASAFVWSLTNRSTANAGKILLVKLINFDVADYCLTRTRTFQPCRSSSAGHNTVEQNRKHGPKKALREAATRSRDRQPLTLQSLDGFSRYGRNIQ